MTTNRKELRDFFISKGHEEYFSEYMSGLIVFSYFREDDYNPYKDKWLPEEIKNDLRELARLKLKESQK